MRRNRTGGWGHTRCIMDGSVTWCLATDFLCLTIVSLFAFSHLSCIYMEIIVLLEGIATSCTCYQRTYLLHWRLPRAHDRHHLPPHSLYWNTKLSIHLCKALINTSLILQTSQKYEMLKQPQLQQRSNGWCSYIYTGRRPHETGYTQWTRMVPLALFSRARLNAD